LLLWVLRGLRGEDFSDRLLRKVVIVCEDHIAYVHRGDDLPPEAAGASPAGNDRVADALRQPPELVGVALQDRLQQVPAAVVHPSSAPASIQVGRGR